MTKQVYKIYIDTGSEFQKECWLRAFSDFFFFFKVQMESKHKKNSFVYHKKTVDEINHISTECFCSNKDAENYKQSFTEFPTK